MDYITLRLNMGNDIFKDLIDSLLNEKSIYSIALENIDEDKKRNTFSSYQFNYYQSRINYIESLVKYLNHLEHKQCKHCQTNPFFNI